MNSGAGVCRPAANKSKGDRFKGVVGTETPGKKKVHTEQPRGRRTVLGRADTGRSSAGTDATAVPQQEGEGLEEGGAGDKDVTAGGQRGPGAAGVSQESRDRRRRLLPPQKQL